MLISMSLKHDYDRNPVVVFPNLQSWTQFSSTLETHLWSDSTRLQSLKVSSASSVSRHSDPHSKQESRSWIIVHQLRGSVSNRFDRFSTQWLSVSSSTLEDPSKTVLEDAWWRKPRKTDDSSLGAPSSNLPRVTLVRKRNDFFFSHHNDALS